MMIRKSKWVLQSSDAKTAELLANSLGLNPLCGTVLYNRGIKTVEQAREFLHPQVSSLHNPFMLKDMEKGVEKIKQVMENQGKIVVYGDYDVDGITAVATIYLYLKSKGADVTYYIPSRTDEGYGLNKEAVNQFKNSGTELIITADCGITADDDIAYAASLGVDVVITDHHQCKEVIPEAYAVINPKREDCTYPFKELSGVGVAFKLIDALENGEKTGELLELYGDLICLGTIADIVTLTDENRIFVTYGLELLKDPNNIGLKALIKESGLYDKTITSSHVGFLLAPRVNAVGRLGNAVDAVKLFTTDSEEEALKLALMLCEENTRRQEIEKQILYEACNIIENEKLYETDRVIVLESENWHHGVIGIVASRISEKYNKPCVLLSSSGDEAKGSCRGVGGFNMFEALAYCSDHLLKYGGHELAAGLAIKRENIPALRDGMNRYAKEKYNSRFFVEEIIYDGKITEKDINLEFTDCLEMIQPCGMGNTAPMFVFEKVKISGISYFGDGKHVKMRFSKKGVSVYVIGFGIGTTGSVKMLREGDIVNALVTPYTNDYRGKRTAALKLKDIKLV